MASSAPATSANVVLGVSLLTSLALLRPKLMTRLPPPWAWDMIQNRKRPMRMNGRKLRMRLSSTLLWLWTVVKISLLLVALAFCRSLKMVRVASVG